MYDIPLAQCLDASIAILVMPPPLPASILVFLNLAEQAFFKACHARAGPQLNSQNFCSFLSRSSWNSTTDTAKEMGVTA